MARAPHFLDPSAEARHAALVTRTRDVARESITILTENPQPDTFLGRKTQEPFPRESAKPPASGDGA